MAYQNHRDAKLSYWDFETRIWDSREEAQDFYDTEYVPRNAAAWTLGLSSVACLSVSGGLWGTLGARR
jgi:hypothetical protein